ncbi:putative RTA1 domain protein [Rhizodiscina lignyota]|uniref:RTA1 domain protein n=1 Tax=Rhizodiscina lignyota TaxID=1504668 RepID=A0A9P4M3H1_9PEZI|nr:putative RTA1 domain protein [Rhizodiscina lignyota]
MSNITNSSSFVCPDNASDICTIGTCPLECAQVTYIPTLAGNTVYVAIFGLILIAQIGLGAWYRTWGFLAGMVFGLILETVGYAGRILMHNNPFDFNNFLIYLICLTIGPAFLSASIYLCLSRIIIVYSPRLSRLQPRTLSLMFMCFDLVALILQAAGGAIAASADDDQNESDTGRNIMIAGLVWQVASLAVFMLLWADYLWRLRKSGERVKNEKLRHLRVGFRRFKYFQYALWTATILIFIRSVYRVVELQGGFDGAVANDEVVFMIFEGPMIILATFVLTVLHPGYAFAGSWQDAAWSLTGKKTEADAEGIML